jgi:hypothetical protein
MKPKGLLIAVAALAVLGGLTWWSNKAQKAKEGKPALDAAPKILTIPDDQMQEIRIAKTGAETITLKKNAAGKWEMTTPKPLAADQDAAGSIASTLASLSADKLIEDKAADLTPYGLTNPGTTVTVARKDGKTDQLLVGDETPTGSGAYVKLAGDARVFTIATYSKSNFEKTATDLRDKRLLTFDSDKITRVTLNAKGKEVEFGKNAQNDWQILKPKPMRADGSQVEDLIRRLKDAKMDAAPSEEDAKKSAAAFASAAKVASAGVTDNNGMQMLEVRKDKDKNYYAKSSVVEGAYKVGTDLGDGLDKTADDFRNKKLYDFGFNDPSKVEVHNGAAAATYSKSGDKWFAGPKQMDNASVQGLIDKLRDLTAMKFLETGGGSPVFDATVTSNDGKRLEKAIVTKQGSQYLAKRDGDPGIYELDSKVVEDLQKAASEVKEAQPEPKKNTKTTRK